MRVIYHLCMILNLWFSTTKRVALQYMNVVINTPLTFPMMKQKIIYRQRQFEQTSDKRCLVPVGQLVKVFGMNQQVEGWNPPGEIFST